MKHPIDPKTLPHQARQALAKPPRKSCVTGFKGVTYIQRTNRYYVRVWRPNRDDKTSIGGFRNVVEAAKAYDEYMRRTVGDWVWCNYNKDGSRNRSKK